MVKDTKALDVRTKIIGVLLQAARLKARRTLKECADQLGCTPHMVSQYEYGRRGISLPELELLAALFDLPVNHLWEEELAVFEEEAGKPLAQELIPLRQKVIGILLRQARMKAGKTQSQCARVLGVSTDTMSKYEHGRKPVPFAQLELMSPYLDLPLSELLDKELSTSRVAISARGGELLSADNAWERLPLRVQDFIRNPEALPYLGTALTLYELPHDSLKRLGEAVLSAVAEE